jgi:hypothetical protein
MEAQMAKPFANPLRYKTFFEDFDLHFPATLTSSTSGWQVVGTGATAVMATLATAGFARLPSALDLSTGTVSGNRTILIPGSTIGSGFGPWHSLLQLYDTEWWFGFGGGFFVTGASTGSFQYGLTAGSANPSDIITTHTGFAFQQISGGNLTFIAGNGVSNGFSQSLGFSVSEAETMNAALAYYKRGKLTLYSSTQGATGRPVYRAPIKVDFNPLTVIGAVTDSVLYLGVKTGAATAAAIAIDYVLSAGERMYSLN